MNQIEVKKRQMTMVSYILGLIALLVIGNLLGDNGIAYLAIAIEVFLLLWTFTGSRLADTLGRLLRGRSSKGQYKNAKKLRRNALVLEGFLGLVGSAVLFFAARWLSEGVFGLPYCTAIIQILAPVIFVRTLSSVLLGYCQGEGTELPTVISGLMRQICILGLSILFGRLLMGYGSKVSALLKQDNFTAMYGGMGVALAVLVTELFILVFLILVYRGSRRNEKRSSAEGMRTTDTFTGQVAILYSNLFPAMLTAFLGMLPMWLGILFFGKSVSDSTSLNLYGIAYGKVLPILGILMIPGCIMLLESCHKAAGCLRREEQRFARGHFFGGLHMAVIYGGFLAAFVAIMAQQIAEIFCANNTELVTKLLRYGSFLIVIVVLSFYFSELLGLLGGKYFLLGLLVVYNLVYAGSLALLLNGNAGVGALLYAALIAGIVYLAGAVFLLFKQLRFGVDWLQIIAVPAGVACAVGLILLFVSRLLTPHLGNLMTVIVSLIAGNLFYWIFLMLMRNFREQELSYTPCGRLIRIMGQMLRVY